MLFQTTHTICVAGNCHSETVVYSVGGCKGAVIVTERATGKSYKAATLDLAVKKMLTCRRFTSIPVLGLEGRTSRY